MPEDYTDNKELEDSYASAYDIGYNSKEYLIDVDLTETEASIALY